MENSIFGAFCVFWVKILISDGKLDFRCILRVLGENLDFPREGLIFGAFCVFWVKISISDELGFRCNWRLPPRNGRFLMVFRGVRLETDYFQRRPCHGDPSGADFSRFGAFSSVYTDGPGPRLSGGGS